VMDEFLENKDYRGKTRDECKDRNERSGIHTHGDKAMSKCS